ncbi:MAG: integrase arm-type DNA-binding domain-containing protein [Devosia sp.]|nr:integrase arm-type DNA-binding domain-containing protein [Devosia sp.]
MPQITLTDVSVRALRLPDKGQVTYWDTALPGFGVRVSQGGTKTFVLVAGANRKRATLGRVGVVSLAEARAEAKHQLALRTLGHIKEKTLPFGAVLDKYVAQHLAINTRPSTAYETERLLRKHFAPPFKATLIADIKRKDIAERIARLTSRPSEANHAFTAVRGLMTWAVRNGFVEHSPCEAMQLPAKPRKRTRKLTDDEVKAIWRVSTDWPWGLLTRFILASGQRRGEIAALRRSWIDAKEQTILFPGSVTKNGRDHLFFYSDLIASLIEDAPNTGDLFLPARGKPEKPLSGFSKGKKTITSNLSLPAWTWHDSRRYYSSTLASLGVMPVVAEALLNHKSGIVSGVSAVYNLYEYADEKKAAQALFESHLQAVLKAE